MNPISTKDLVLTPDSKVSGGFRFLMLCEDYFHLFTRKAAPIAHEKDRTVFYHLAKVDVEASCWATTLKVGSYILLIVPIVAGVTVLIGRNRYTYQGTEKLNHIRTASGQEIIRLGGTPYTPRHRKDVS